MARKKKEKKPGFVDRILIRYYRRKLDANAAVADDELEIISEKEEKVIRHQMLRTAIIAGSLGALGVLFLYVPKYLFPHWFENYIYFTIPYIEGVQKFEWVFMLYSIILAQIEAYLLVYFNARAVAKISNANGFPVVQSPDFDKHMNGLVVVALEKKDRTIKKYGIDPYFGLSKLGLFVYMMIIRFKATLSNLFVKLVIGRILGRAVLRIYIDMVGLVVYPIWNIVASMQVIRESKLRIMAPNLIRWLVNDLFEKYGHNSIFEKNLFHTLSFLSQVKRNYNFNLYLLTDAMISTFNIEKPEHNMNITQYTEHLKVLGDENRNGLMRVIVFGMLIDGKLTKREKKILKYLYAEGISGIPSEISDQWSKDYLAGKGMGGFKKQMDFILKTDLATQGI
jgi:hypothetical protein